MFSSAAALSAFLLLPAVLGQNVTSDSTTTTTNTSTTSTTTPATTSATTPSTGTGSTPFTVPTVTGTTCGTAQQNFNQCVTKVGKDISNCPSTDNVCLCQTYANIAACYNACPELQDGATYKDQSTQYCAEAKISPPSIYNQTSPVVNTTTTPATTPATTSNTTPSRTNTTSSPVTTASAFARASSASTLGFSTALFGITTGLYALLFV
ncbi:secreted protein [Melampsora americana]|nr:secreted protein [Melampsora americana]